MFRPSGAAFRFSRAPPVSEEWISNRNGFRKRASCLKTRTVADVNVQEVLPADEFFCWKHLYDLMRMVEHGYLSRDFQAVVAHMAANLWVNEKSSYTKYVRFSILDLKD